MSMKEFKIIWEITKGEISFKGMQPSPILKGLQEAGFKLDDVEGGENMLSYSKQVTPEESDQLVSGLKGYAAELNSYFHDCVVQGIKDGEGVEKSEESKVVPFPNRQYAIIEVDESSIATTAAIKLDFQLPF